MLKKVLVLDDNQDILDIIQEALSYEKFEVKITSHGDHIISLIESFQPNIVLLDYRLIGLKGDFICREIKTHPKFYDLPVIICSAYLNISSNAELTACGCDAIITKPFGLEELVDKINDLISV